MQSYNTQFIILSIVLVVFIYKCFMVSFEGTKATEQQREKCEATGGAFVREYSTGNGVCVMKVPDVQVR